MIAPARQVASLPIVIAEFANTASRGVLLQSIMLEQLLKNFFVLFLVVEPISLVPMFGALTRGGTAVYRRRMAVKASILAAVIFLAFALVGDYVLAALGISVAAFRIAGGVLLFLLALDMVLARSSGLRSTTIREQDEARYREDISVFPLAFPLIAGPGALATLLLLLGDIRTDPLMFISLLGIVILVVGVTLLLLLLSTPIMRVLGITGANVVSRLLGVVLAALAVQYVVDGIVEVAKTSFS